MTLAVQEKHPPLAQIVGIGLAQETDTISGGRYSVGNGLREALEACIQDAKIDEANIHFRVSDMLRSKVIPVNW